MVAAEQNFNTFKPVSCDQERNGCGGQLPCTHHAVYYCAHLALTVAQCCGDKTRSMLLMSKGTDVVAMSQQHSFEQSRRSAQYCHLP